jgi:hypothetical protein
MTATIVHSHSITYNRSHLFPTVDYHRPVNALTSTEIPAIATYFCNISVIIGRNAADCCVLMPPRCVTIRSGGTRRIAS